MTTNRIQCCPQGGGAKQLCRKEVSMLLQGTQKTFEEGQRDWEVGPGTLSDVLFLKNISVVNVTCHKILMIINLE